MKIRINYVSNSSSASFVVCGYLMEDKDRKRFYDLAKEYVPELVEKYNNDFEYFDDEVQQIGKDGLSIIPGDKDNGLPVGKTFIGKFLGKSDLDIYNFEDKTLGIKEIEKELIKTEKYLNEDEKELKIIIGTMCI